MIEMEWYVTWTVNWRGAVLADRHRPPLSHQISSKFRLIAQERRKQS
jgi:hypothetical protein